jgi:ribosomal protein S12 methylthiotransferase
MYAYPQHISPRLIEQMAINPQICHYLDLPLQHADPATLRRMRRSSDVEGVRLLIERLRSAMPDVALRTTFIVGFPGETESEFLNLLDFMRSVAFDRVGVFKFSPEEGTVAASFPDPVPAPVAEERYARAMELQRTISLQRNQAQIGRTMKVLVEGSGDGVTLSRSYRDAPEIDGYVILPRELKPGQMVQAKIVEAMDYDLRGDLVER